MSKKHRGAVHALGKPSDGFRVKVWSRERSPSRATRLGGVLDRQRRLATAVVSCWIPTMRAPRGAR